MRRKREAYRQFLFGTLAPLGRLIASELSVKLEAEIKLDWTELRASDDARTYRRLRVHAANTDQTHQTILESALAEYLKQASS